LASFPRVWSVLAGARGIPDRLALVFKERAHLHERDEIHLEIDLNDLS